MKQQGTGDVSRKGEWEVARQAGELRKRVRLADGLEYILPASAVIEANIPAGLNKEEQAMWLERELKKPINLK